MEIWIPIVIGIGVLLLLILIIYCIIKKSKQNNLMSEFANGHAFCIIKHKLKTKSILSSRKTYIEIEYTEKEPTL